MTGAERQQQREAELCEALASRGFASVFFKESPQIAGRMTYTLWVRLSDGKGVLTISGPKGVVLYTLTETTLEELNP